MDEAEVSKRTATYLKASGYTITREPVILNGEIRLDYFGYKETSHGQDRVLVECKAHEKLSILLEGWVRLQFGMFYYGCKGILALSSDSASKLRTHMDFLRTTQRPVCFLDVEKDELHQV